MRLNALVLGSKAVRDRNVERLEGFHLPVEPIERIRPIRVGPTDSCPDVLDAEILQMPNGIVEPVVLEMKPLADTQVAECTCENACTKASAFHPREAAPCRSGDSRTSPRLRDAASWPASARGKIVQTVPVDSINLALQQLGRTLKSPFLHFLGAERRYADLGDPDAEAS